LGGGGAAPGGPGKGIFVQRLYSRFAFLVSLALLAIPGINNFSVFNGLRGFDSRRLHHLLTNKRRTTSASS
jgi:hypothetical protein